MGTDPRTHTKTRSRTSPRALFSMTASSFLGSSLPNSSWAPLVDADPAARRGERLLLQIDRDHVCAHRTDTTIRSVSHRGSEPGPVLVQSLQGLNQLLSTQVFAGALQSFDQYLG